MPTARCRSWPLLSVAALATAALAAPAVAGVTLYDIFYSRIYSQATPNVVPNNSPRFIFISRLISNNPPDLSTCSLSIPGRPARSLIEFDPGEYIFFAPTEYFSEATLANDFPAGQYRHNIAGGTLGTQGGNLVRPNALLWPGSVPFFTGNTLTRLGAVNSKADFSISVNNWTPIAGTNISRTFFVAYDNQTGAATLTVDVPSNSTSIMIPADALLPSRTYTVELIFTSRVATPNAAFGAATGIVGFDYRTSASLTTVAACLVDFNADGFLNQEDLGAFLTAFLDESIPAGPSGTSASPCPGEPEPYNTLGYAADFNRDCSFNQEDLSGFLTEYFEQSENPTTCVSG